MENRPSVAKSGLVRLLFVFHCAIGLFAQVSSAQDLLNQNSTVFDALSVAEGGQAPTPLSPSTPPAPAPASSPVDPMGRSTPRGTVLGFLHAADRGDYATAAAYLDSTETPEETQQLATELKGLLDRGLSTSISDISNQPEGDVQDRLRLSRERIGYVKTPGGEIEILLDLVHRPGQAPIWLFSSTTLSQVPRAFASEEPMGFTQALPAWSKSIQFFSLPLWRWGAIFIWAILGLGFAFSLTKGLLFLFQRAFRSRPFIASHSTVASLRPPLFGMILACITRVSASSAVTALARHYWESAAVLLFLISSAWLFLRIIDIISSFATQHLVEEMQVQRTTVVVLLRRFLKIAVVLLAVILLLRRAGINVSALLAGLGIGGIALALAAQRTLADLFGGLSTVIRGAIRVGDMCEIGGRTGTVEDIGLSSLRLRTLDRTVVSIPNAKVAEVELENYSLRDKFWFHQVFALRPDTPHEVVRVVLERIGNFLDTKADVDRTSARVRLLRLSPAGPELEIYAYVTNMRGDYAAFLGIQEQMILQIMSLVDAAGGSIAPPVNVIRIERDRT